MADTPYLLAYTGPQVDQALSMALAAYPVGSIYLSVSATNPGTIFGGTWQQIQGRFLLAASSAYPAGSTGGAATHTLTTNEMPSHGHGFLQANNNGTAGTWVIDAGTTNARKVSASSGVVTPTGGGQAFAIMPPYLSVYMWRRTA